MSRSSISAPAHQASEKLGLWEPKRSLTLSAARRHSTRIVFLRRVLLGLAAVLILALGAQFINQPGAFEFDDNPGESVKMINPRYSGRTNDGLPYRLTSDSAVRMTQTATEVALEKPILNFLRTAEAEESQVIADTGTYDDVNQILDLRKAVDLKTDDGYHCTTTHARVYAREKRIEGDEPITCTGNFGIVKGKSYEILENYTVFVFKEGMNAYLDSENTGDDASADTGGNYMTQNGGDGTE